MRGLFSRGWRWLLLIGAVAGAGFWLKSLAPEVAGLRLPATGPIATLYFAAGEGAQEHLFPVSRRMPSAEDLPRATLDSLIGGPPPGSGLRNSVPEGVQIRTFRVADRTAWVDLSAEFRRAENNRPDGIAMAEIAIIDTLTSIRGVNAVAISVDGKPLREPAHRIPLLYYATPGGLAAIPAATPTPRAALDKYLEGPSGPSWNGLPADVRLLKYAYDADNKLVSLSFTYTEAVRMLAVDLPDRMRLALLGLIASLTEYPDVDAVRIDFEGRTRLGLGECSDLLLTPQPRPGLLNDERLLGR